MKPNDEQTKTILAKATRALGSQEEAEQWPAPSWSRPIPGGLSTACTQDDASGCAAADQKA